MGISPAVVRAANRARKVRLGGTPRANREFWLRSTNGNTNDTIDVLKIVEYLDETNHSPFARWFDGLDAQSAAKVSVALMRMESGNLSNAKALGAGLSEYRLNWGPGYRIYFGRDDDTLIILIAGGTKRRQQNDIDAAQTRWANYKQRKKEGS